MASSSAALDPTLPIIDVQRVSLQFLLSSPIVATAVSSNVLLLALASNRLLRFDLENPSDIDDIDLPLPATKIGTIRKLFLDPTGSHCLISTTLGEVFYLHSNGRVVKSLGRLRGVVVEAVAWNVEGPTQGTREILVGGRDGGVWEVVVESGGGGGFMGKEERFAKRVWEAGEAVTGLWADFVGSRQQGTRRIVVASQGALRVWIGKGGRSGDTAGVFGRLFEGETPSVYEVERGDGYGGISSMAVSPDAEGGAPGNDAGERAYAWLCAQGVYSGPLPTQSTDLSALGRQMFHDSHMFPKSQLPPMQSSSGRNRTTQPPISSMILTQFHILVLQEGRLTAISRLDDTIVYNQEVLEAGQTILGLYADQQKNTYWLLTSAEIYEIVVTDENRDVWKIMLKKGNYEAAQRYAHSTEEKDAVAAATGDHLIGQGKFAEAATVLGKSSKPFEDVALGFIDKGEHDALRKYLLTKLAGYPKSFIMQRTLLVSWLTELYMAKLNQLDDTISTKAEVAAGSTASEMQKQLPAVRKEYQDFVTRNKADLDVKTTYEVISAHGREEELLYFANVVHDFDYVLEYWVQRERWAEAMAVLKKQTAPEVFYKYSTVLMSHSAVDLIEVLMRQPSLDPKKIIPALLTYNRTIGSSVPLAQNQAIRYLSFCINHQVSTLPAVHNTLIALYASSSSPDESALLSYLETQSAAHEHHYDADFALRLCIAHKRVASAVHVYCTMNQPSSAVDLALKYNEIEIAASVADRPGNDDLLRKKLWLKVAKKVISQNKGIKPAMEFLKRCELLRIEDLIPFFPDFVVIDDFKAEICAALENYSREIDGLKASMDASAATAQSIKSSISAIDSRYAIVEPGERCWKCRMPLLMRQFFVFPCQHAFHADCLGEMVMGVVGMGKGKRIRELQREVGRVVAAGGRARKEGLVRELDGLVAGACVLCGEGTVRMIDEPFILEADNKEEWAI
nr:hypothetical protein B0A51_16507 [Rachicladosporium sp. CCFEE 5018]